MVEVVVLEGVLRAGEVALVVTLLHHLLVVLGVVLLRGAAGVVGVILWGC